MAGVVLVMSDLSLNKHWCKLKDLCFKTATRPYTYRCSKLPMTKLETISILCYKKELELHNSLIVN